MSYLFKNNKNLKPTGTPISAWVKGDRQKGSQVNPTATLISTLVKGNRQMRF